ncbi:hypothetical protein [Pseudomonas sp. NPDC090201]|uniref:hypothetical protein n=1 Tax=Pseudomonas sp. NPDC090201 TaxID=3364475 RepID=UPI003812B5CE
MLQGQYQKVLILVDGWRQADAVIAPFAGASPLPVKKYRLQGRKIVLRDVSVIAPKAVPEGKWPPFSDPTSLPQEISDAQPS